MWMWKVTLHLKIRKANSQKQMQWAAIADTETGAIEQVRDYLFRSLNEKDTEEMINDEKHGKWKVEKSFDPILLF